MDQTIQHFSVAIGDAENDMVLHEDVVSSAGQVLLAAGEVLTWRHIQLLSANGIEKVVIRRSTKPNQKSIKSPLTATEIDNSLKSRFRDNDPDHPVIKELARICRARMEAQQ